MSIDKDIAQIALRSFIGSSQSDPPTTFIGWCRQTTALPLDRKERFGVRTAPATITCIFGDVVADGVWRNGRVPMVHCVDNFFGFTIRGGATVDRLIVQALLRSTGWSLNADDSAKGTAVSALGIALDTVNATISVTEAKTH